MHQITLVRCFLRIAGKAREATLDCCLQHVHLCNIHPIKGISYSLLALSDCLSDGQSTQFGKDIKSRVLHCPLLTKM